MGLSIFDEASPVLTGTVINSGTGTTIQPILNNPGQSVRFDEVYARNWDTVDHVVTVYLEHNGVGYVVGTVNVPAFSLAVQGLPTPLFATLGLTAQAGVVLGALDELAVAVAVAVGTGAVHFTAVGGIV